MVDLKFDSATEARNSDTPTPFCINRQHKTRPPPVKESKALFGRPKKDFAANHAAGESRERVADESPCFSEKVVRPPVRHKTVSELYCIAGYVYISR